MPSEIHMTRTPAGLIPASPEAQEWLERVKLGQPVGVRVVQKRNGKFFRKFWAMIDVAYTNHEWPEVQTQWGKARVSRDLFRRYVTVKAGHYEVGLTPHGEVRAEPKSIAWAKMDEHEFEKLYSDVLDVILGEFLKSWKRDDMDAAVERMMSFA